MFLVLALIIFLIFGQENYFKVLGFLAFSIALAYFAYPDVSKLISDAGRIRTSEKLCVAAALAAFPLLALNMQSTFWSISILGIGVLFTLGLLYFSLRLRMLRKILPL